MCQSHIAVGHNQRPLRCAGADPNIGTIKRIDPYIAGVDVVNIIADCRPSAH